MAESIVFPLKKEFGVTVEDLTFKLIIDKTDFCKTELIFLSNSFHVHSHVEMFVCTSGMIMVDTPDGLFELHDGDVAVIPPNYPHTRIETTDEICEWCAISFLFFKRQMKDAKELYDTYKSLIAENKVVVLSDKHKFCAEIYDVVKTSFEYDSIQPALRVVTAINGILDEFLKVKSDYCLQNKCNTSSDIDIDLLYKLNYIINTSFKNELTNAQIAKMLFISERQLSRIAAKHYGTSIHQAIIDRRLAIAEKLLNSSEMTIENIGASVGYKSKSGFYRDFRKKYGVTPIEYRSKHTDKDIG